MAHARSDIQADVSECLAQIARCRRVALDLNREAAVAHLSGDIETATQRRKTRQTVLAAKLDWEGRLASAKAHLVAHDEQVSRGVHA